MQARLSNAATRLLSHEMQKLQREEDGPGIGQEPGLGVTFPTTRGGIELLTNQQLDDLEAFYGVNFGGQSVSARQVKFARFIGA